MKVRHSRPLWLIAFVRLFGMRPGKGAIFTFGDTVYSPGPLTIDLLTHEQAHRDQQRAQGFLGRYRWWLRYATDPGFRFEQEAQAYGLQFRCIQERLPRRVALKSLFEIVDLLRSPMYGLTDCTQERARERIQDWARYPATGQRASSDSTKETASAKTNVVRIAAATSKANPTTPAI